MTIENVQFYSGMLVIFPQSKIIHTLLLTLIISFLRYKLKLVISIEIDCHGNADAIHNYLEVDLNYL